MRKSLVASPPLDENRPPIRPHASFGCSSSACATIASAKSFGRRSVMCPSSLRAGTRVYAARLGNRLDQHADVAFAPVGRDADDALTLAELARLRPRGDEHGTGRRSEEQPELPAELAHRFVRFPPRDR